MMTSEMSGIGGRDWKMSKAVGVKEPDSPRRTRWMEFSAVQVDRSRDDECPLVFADERYGQSWSPTSKLRE